MQVEAWPLGQPVADDFSLMGSVVVQNQVNVEFGRNVVLDGVEEGAELDGAVAAMGVVFPLPVENGPNAAVLFPYL